MTPRIERAWAALKSASQRAAEAERTGPELAIAVAYRNHTLALREWREATAEDDGRKSA